MSVLNPQPAPPVNPAVRAAAQLKQQARNTFQQLVGAFNQGAQQFWKNQRAKPSEIAAALGTDAKEVFELHGKIGALLAEIKPEAIAPGLAAVGNFEYNVDGTVVVLDPVPPAPVTPPPAA
jgi:hypothetical protein